jgi:glycosyltransferase involved in cell wall biosynthesis
VRETSETAAPLKEQTVEDRADVRVVLLTNFVPPYRLPVYEALAARVRELTVLVSVPVEENRSWRPRAGSLDVRVQRTLTLRRSWRHPTGGFSDRVYVHVPWDTLPRLHKLRPDVVLSGELGFRSLFAAAYCLLSRRSRLVLWATLSERTEEGRGRLRQALRHALLRRADRVIVNGASGERYVRGFGVPPERIDRVPYTALPAFAAAGAAARRSIGSVRALLFVGELVERKGLVPFLRTLDRWGAAHREERLTLTVVGSGPVRSELESFRPSGSLTVRLLGERDPAELPELYAQADALVLPTLADEWGLVVSEALAAGVPVLGSIHSQAVEELCEEGVTGWLFDPDDGESTLSALDRALTTPVAEVESMRERARLRVRDLTPERAADRVVATIRAALSAA